MLIALFFIVFLILTAFGKVEAEEFDNTVVRTICLVLGGIFAALSVATQVILYLNEDAVKEIVLRSEREGTARTSLAVVKKIAKGTVKNIEGVKCTKCAVISNDFGIRLRVWLKIKGRDMKETEDLVRACLEDAFLGALRFRFFAIDINVKQIEAKHTVDRAAVEQKLAEKKAEEEPLPDVSPVETIEAPAVPEETETAEAPAMPEETEVPAEEVLTEAEEENVGDGAEEATDEEKELR